MRPLDTLSEVDIDGFLLSGVHHDMSDGLVVSLRDPTVPADRWHVEGALHLAFEDWAFVGGFRPSFGPLRALAVDRSAMEPLERLPVAWFSEPERAQMRRVRMFDHELDLPVLELLAYSAEVRRGPLRAHG